MYGLYIMFGGFLDTGLRFLKRLQGQSPLEGPKVLMPGIKTGVVPFRVCNLPQSVLQYPHESGGFYGKNLVCVPRQYLPQPDGGVCT